MTVTTGTPGHQEHSFVESPIDPVEEANYNIRLPQSQVADVARTLVAWRQRSSAVRDHEIGSRVPVRYGADERDVLDVFLPLDGRSGEVVVFWHGGFFRHGKANEYTFLVPPFLERGAIVVVPEYRLAPHNSVADILRATLSAHEQLVRSISSFGGNPTKITVIGHSIGATILAYAMAHGWAAGEEPNFDPLVASALAISGVFDLQPILRTSINTDLKMTRAAAQAVSPALATNRSRTKIHYAVGELETAGFQGQTREMARKPSWRGPVTTIPGAHHLSVLEDLANPHGVMWQQEPLAMLGRR